jgi:hypothetical protein
MCRRVNAYRSHDRPSRFKADIRFVVYPKYSALKEGEIRVLELKPGSGDSPIVFSLKHVSLLEPLQYEAISYVWGNGLDLHYINFEENSSDSIRPFRKSVTVTRNLRDALQQFRDPVQSRTIWADALCINQQDFSERAQQVRLMGEIYVKAHRVLMWLGLEDEETSDAVGFLVNVANICGEKQELEKYKKIDTLGQLTELIDVSELPYFEGELAATRLFIRPWFYRIWVVQEVASGREVLVSIGPHTVPFDHMGLGAIWINEIQSRGRISIASFVGPFNAIKIWQKWFTEAFSPAELLDYGRYLLATDSRDKVYGLLGFSVLQDALCDLEPDYDKSVEDVYTETAVKIIQKTGNLDILSLTEGPPRTEDSFPLPKNDQLGWPNTPSWVARWDEQTYFLSSALINWASHNENNSKPPISITFADAGTGGLKLGGVLLDQVVYVAPYVHWSVPPDDSILKPTNPKVFIEMWKAILDRGSNSSQTDTLSAWIQAMTGGIAEELQFHLADFSSFMLDALDPPGGSEKMEPAQQEFCRLLRGLKHQFPDRDHTIFRRIISTILPYRRVFMTAHGRIGLGHSRVLINDSVVWLYGGKVPFILRSRGENWGFVGECFLYDVKKKKSLSLESKDHSMRKAEFELR